VSLPQSAKTKETIEINFTTKEGSTVYLLAFDKRLTYLRDGNDVKRDDVVETLAGYDAYNNITTLRLDGWDDCTDEELDRIENGRKNTVENSGDIFDVHEKEDLGDESYDDEPFAPEEIPIHIPQEEGDDLREYFPESWQLKEINMSDTNETMLVKVPDSITSWIISAFAMNNDTGLAIAPTKELIVKNEFFMKIFLPYSIRFKEILRLDIFVYNYINEGKSLNVNVTLKNQNQTQFEFVQYNGCDVTFYDAVYSSQMVNVPHNDVRKVSYFIKSRTDKAEYEQRINIFVKAVGFDNNNREYVDTMGKVLRVEPIGVKIYDIETKNKKLVKTHKPIEVINQANLTEYEESHPRFSVAISSDYLAESLNISTNFQ